MRGILSISAFKQNAIHTAAKLWWGTLIIDVIRTLIWKLIGKSNYKSGNLYSECFQSYKKTTTKTIIKKSWKKKNRPKIKNVKKYIQNDKKVLKLRKMLKFTIAQKYKQNVKIEKSVKIHHWPKI